jgi:HSP20 family protein
MSEKKEIIATEEKGVKEGEMQKREKPYSPFEEMEHLFDDFFQRRFFAPSFMPRLKFPEFANTSTSIDMFEDGTDLVIKADLPGMKKEEISIEFNNDVITISGEKKSEEKTERKDYFRVERSFGSFVRKLRLPVDVQVDKVNASFKDGVLEVRMPKSLSDKPNTRKITVK